MLTLREALALADADSLTADRIEFAPAVQGRTIVLGGSQLTVNSDVTIDGGAGVTIDANQASRVLLVQGLDTDVMLRHLTITGGRTTGDDEGGGGGIRADRYTTLTLEQSRSAATARRVLAAGSTAGMRRDADRQHGQRQQHGGDGGGTCGGGISVADRQSVSGNRTGRYAEGGGLATR